MKNSSISLLLYLLLSFQVSAAEHITFVNAWIPEAPPGASVMAGYMEIHNTSSKQIDIISINSTAFKNVEMHQSKEVDGFAKMLPQKKLSIPGNGKLLLKSGSYHLMLIKPEKWFKHGDKIKLNFTFSNNTQKNFTLKNIVFDVRKKASPTMKCAAGKCGGM
jgi:periplasmic copper chaperone A